MSSFDEDVLRFIAASFPSVWALEILLSLKRERRLWTRQELVSAHRASELVVSRGLEALVAGGLASFEDDGARYAPVNRDVEIAVDRAEELYRTRPNAVRRAIVAAGTSSATAFAAAFKLRKGRDD